MVREVSDFSGVSEEEKSQPRKALAQEGSARGNHRAKLEGGKEAMQQSYKPQKGVWFFPKHAWAY